MKKAWIAAVAVLIIAVAAFAVMRGRAATPATQTEPTAVPVVDTTLVAEARVVPVRGAALSLAGGGVVAEVLVKEGDAVQSGQPLIRLDRARAQATVALAQAQLARAQAAFGKLHTGATAEELAAAEAQLRLAQAQQRQASGGVTSADRAAAQAQLAEAQARLASLQAGPRSSDAQSAQAQLAQAQANLQAQRDSLSAGKTNARLALDQATSALTQAQSAYSTALQNWQYVQDTGNDPIVPTRTNAQGKAVANRLNDAQRQQYYNAFVQAEAAMHSAESGVQQAQVVYDNARQAEISGVAAAQAAVDQSQAALDKLRAGADAEALAAARAAVASSRAQLDKLTGDQRDGALAAAQAAVDQAQARLDELRAGVSQDDLAMAEADVQSAQAALSLAEATAAEGELRAPFAGTVAALDATVGEFLAPGTPVAYVGDLASWQVETTDLTELNVAAVKIGSPATITFDAIPDLALSGKVTRVRALGESKQGDITYTVTIALDKQDPRLRWNMTASATIDK